MAETAALTNAYAHARKAADETQQINWGQAAQEHESAAIDYARASKCTTDNEALRILRLLEGQHVKLANIIRAQDANEHSEQPDVEPGSNGDIASKPEKPASDLATAQSHSTTAPQTTSALAGARFGSSTRDSSPSLAREIASRRGIPQPNRNPPSAAAQARARQLSPESHRRNRPTTAPGAKIPPSIIDSQNIQPPKKSQKAENDELFTRFYTNLTTGTMSKLSSVMAYAGLPLTADDVKTEPTSQPRLTKQTVSANNDVDVKKIFSKAALAAIEDEHRQRGHQGHAFGPAESFYVVQTGGGTYSYADITKAQQQQLAGIDEDDEEAFVDAREAPAPSSPRNSRFSSRGRGSFGHSRTHEELELENVTLKQTLEQLATRLTEFETHAQDASMAALTQSMASTHTPGPSGGPDPTLIARLRQVEQQLEQKQEEMQKWQSHVAKQDKQLKKYQSKWEEIKQSAKEKQKAKAEKSEKASEAASTIADAG